MVKKKVIPATKKLGKELITRRVFAKQKEKPVSVIETRAMYCFCLFRLKLITSQNKHHTMI